MTTGNRTNVGGEKPYKLLIADDQPQILEALRLLLKPEGYLLEMVRTPALLLDALMHESFDGVLIDLNYTRDTTSGQEGLELVARIKEIDPQLPIVAMTAWGNIDLAVEAMRRGASDFIQKPWENPRLLSVLRTQMELHRSQRRTQWLEAENRILRAPGAPDFIASAASMHAGAGDDVAGGPFGCQCVDHWRTWDGQRGSSADAAQALCAGFTHFGGCQYWRAA